MTDEQPVTTKDVLDGIQIETVTIEYGVSRNLGDYNHAKPSISLTARITDLPVAIVIERLQRACYLEIEAFTKREKRMIYWWKRDEQAREESSVRIKARLEDLQADTDLPDEDKAMFQAQLETALAAAIKSEEVRAKAEAERKAKQAATFEEAMVKAADSTLGAEGLEDLIREVRFGSLNVGGHKEREAVEKRAEETLAALSANDPVQVEPKVVEEEWDEEDEDFEEDDDADGDEL